MNAILSMITGAGLMYLLDPDQGRSRRAQLRDKYTGLANDLQKATNVVTKDMSNRMQGLRSGDMTVLVGGKNALASGLRGSWTPTGRTILGGLGTGLFLYGLASRAPKACVLGTIGLAMIAEAITNAGIEDIRQLPRRFSSSDGKPRAQGKNRSVPAADRGRELAVSEATPEFLL